MRDQSYKFRIHIPLLLIVLVSIVCPAVFSDSATPERPVFEKGDFIYRELGTPWYIPDTVGWYIGHAGIYYRYISKDPNDLQRHVTIESLGVGPTYNNFYNFFNTPGLSFRSVRNVSVIGGGTLSAYERDRIIDIAISQIENSQYHFWDGYKNPFGTNSYVHPEEGYISKSFRCDGLTEYCYEVALNHDWRPGNNGGIIPNDVPYPLYQERYEAEYPGIRTMVLLPTRQESYLPRRVTSLPPTPATKFITPSHNNALNQWNDPQSKTLPIDITWQDATDEHSGLWGYFVEWDTNKDTIPTHTDKTDYMDETRHKAIKADDQGKTEQKDTSPELPDGKWYFHIRSIDKAGNWDEDNKGLLTTMHIGPFFIDKTLPSISISGVTNGGVYYGSVTVKYTVRDKYLKTNSVEPKWEGPSPVIIDPDNIPNSGDEYTEEVTASKVFEPPADYEVIVRAKDMAGNWAEAKVSFTIEKPTDNPDDNESTSTDVTKNPVYSDPNAPIAVLKRGYWTYLGNLLTSLKEPFQFVDTDFSTTIVDKMPILLIPTAGLSGLENSEFLKAKFEEYVKSGGRIFCLSQQHGYEYATLPGGLSGYGWVEDQSCWYGASYIDKYHQILSGQVDVDIDGYIDGYFTQWPEGAISILRRTKNLMPAMLIYDFGVGKVVATTSYMDWGFQHQQFSEDDRRLIRDALNWLKENRQLAEYKPGETVRLQLTVNNLLSNAKEATSVKILIIEPDKKILSAQTYRLPVTLKPGESSTVGLNYQSSSGSPLGIWQVNYILLDEANNSIQDEKVGGRFVVSNPQVYKPRSEITVDITTDAEYYLYGSEAVFSIHIRNHSDTDRTFILNGNQGFAQRKDIVLANSELVFEHRIRITNNGYLYIQAYDENSIMFDNAIRGFYVNFLSVGLEAKTDKRTYNGGENVSIFLNGQNNLNLSFNSILKVTVIDPSKNEVLSDSFEIAMGPMIAFNRTLNLPLAVTAEAGIYVVNVVVNVNNAIIATDSEYFEVTGPRASITPILPEVLDSGSKISFDIKNIGSIDISTAKLQIALLEPDGNSILNAVSEDFALVTGQIKKLDFNLTAPALKFGEYKLEYKLMYDGKITFGNKIILCASSIKLSLDKNSYRARDEIALKANVTNAGNFNQSLSIITKAVSCNFEDTQIFTLAPNVQKEFTYQIKVPETINPGKHDIAVGLDLSESQTEKIISFVVPQSKLSLSLDDNLGYQSGNSVNIRLDNIGGVDTSFESTVVLKDMKVWGSSVDKQSGNILAGSSASINFIIPQGVIEGNYLISAEVKDLKTNIVSKLDRTIFIRGLKAVLDVDTDKLVYFKDEPISGSAEMVNLDGPINGAKLDLRVFQDKGASWTPLPANNTTIFKIIPDKNELWVIRTPYDLEKYNEIDDEWEFYTPLNKDLKISSVRCVTIDEDKIWIGGLGGVSCYNKQTGEYTSYPSPYYKYVSGRLELVESNNSMRGSVVDSIVVDGDDIWFKVGGYQFGSSTAPWPASFFATEVDRFNKKTGEWTRFDSETPGFPPFRVSGDMVVDKDDVWIQGNNSVYRYNKAQNIWQAYTPQNSGLADGYVRKVISDGQDVWIAAYAYLLGKDVLCRFNKSTELWETYTFDMLDYPFIYDIVVGLNGAQVWISTLEGVMRYDKATNIWTTFTPQNSELPNGVLKIAIMGDDVWFGGSDDKIVKHNVATNSWSTYDIAGNWVNQIIPYKDRVYVLSQEWGYSSVINRYDASNDMWTMIQRNDGIPPITEIRPVVDGSDVWFVPINRSGISRNGFYKYNKIFGSWTTYNTSNSGLMDNYITAFDVDNENVWIGTGRGLSRYNKLNQTWQNYQFYSDELQIGSVKTILVDGDKVWLGGAYGVSKYNKQADTWVSYTVDRYEYISGYVTLIPGNSGLGITLIESILPDGEDVWFAGGAKVSRYNQLSNTWTNYSSTNSPLPSYGAVQCMTIGVGDLWVGVGGISPYILARYDKGTDTWYGYSQADLGFTSYYYAPYVRAIAFDGQELWGSVYSGIYSGVSRYNFATDIWTAYTATRYSYDYYGRTILMSGNSELAVSQVHQIIPDGNEIWFVGDYGVSLYDKERDVWQIYAQDKGSRFPPVSSMSLGEDEAWVGISNYGAMRLKFERNENQPLWQKEIPVDLVNSLKITEQITGLKDTGKFYLQGRLYSNKGQEIVADRTPFYITEGVLSLTIETDKKDYKPNEVISITGEVKNYGELPLSGLTLGLKKDYESIYNSALFDLAKGQAWQFTVSTTAAQSFNLNAKVGDVIIEDYIIVEKPDLDVTINAPDAVGRGDFKVGVLLENTKRVSAIADVDISGRKRNVTVEPNSSYLLEETFNITNNTTINVTLSGEVNKSASKAIRFGEKVEIKAELKAFYLEPNAEIPLTINNIGELDSQVSVNMAVKDTANQTVYAADKIYTVIKNTSLNDWLNLQLSEGNYALSITSFFGGVDYEFKVVKENQLSLTLDVQPMTNGRIPAKLKVKNIGYNDFNGALRLDSGFYLDESELSLSIGEEKEISYSLNPLGAKEGNYRVIAEIFYGGNSLYKVTKEVFVQGPVFTITSKPASLTSNLGEQSTITFKLKNTGGLPGEAEFGISCLDIINETRKLWLDPGQEEELTFNLMIPDDLPGKEYSIAYGFSGGISGYIPLQVNGPDVTVSATLDKPIYNLGDTANLTLTINNNNNITSNMYSLVKYKDYEARQDFVLTNAATLNFSIPIQSPIDEQLLYSVYLNSGRSLYINYMDLHLSQEAISLYTDKQVYNLGEVVTLFIDADKAGELQISAPGFSQQLQIPIGKTTLNFTLPQDLTGGTHIIRYVFDDVEYQYFFDVLGDSLRIVEVSLDKPKYLPQDKIEFNLAVEAEKDMQCEFKGWVFYPDKNYTSSFSETKNLVKGRNDLKTIAQFDTQQLGIHSLNYGFYKQSSKELLGSGIENFDVGGAVLIGFATDKAVYYANESVNAIIKAFGKGTEPIILYLDERLVWQGNIDVAGYNELKVNIGRQELGTHTLIARFGSVLTGEMKTSFEVKDDTPPVTVFDYTKDDIWVNEDVHIKFIATDDYSGVKATHYVIDEGEEKIGTDINFIAEGIHTLKFWSEDNAGNAEEPHFIIVKIDKTVPEIKMTSPSDGGEYFHDIAIPIVVSVNDVLSGVKSHNITIDDIDITAQTSILPQIGEHTIKVTAEDNAGNRAVAIGKFIMKLRASVEIKPEVLNVNDGVFTARVVFPQGYDVSTISSAKCDGAANQNIEYDAISKHAIIKFRRQDITESPLDIHFTVRGYFSSGYLFEGSDDIMEVKR